ncbi:unnamed protein product [Moneuplotes crassus]|uniref:Uncharacterized protein n=1 Tax=Euplotes crassus TaxID=5936 RepID=A0AAD2D288_EUPCR|nr:unnamed protein product [Moneuplotes crassus]
MKRMQDNKPKKLLKADQSCIIQQDSKKNLKMSSIQVIKANSTDKRDKRNIIKSLQVTENKGKIIHKSVLPKTKTGIIMEEREKLMKESLTNNFERLKTSKVFSDTSPETSMTTIPREMIFETSELKESREILLKKVHTKSQYSAPPRRDCTSPIKKQLTSNKYEVPVATYDENYSFKNSRQAGNYKCSLWKLQKTKANNNMKKLAQTSNLEGVKVKPHSLIHPGLKRPRVDSFNSSKQGGPLGIERRSNELTLSQKEDNSNFSSRNSKSILPEGQSLPLEDCKSAKINVKKDRRVNKLLYSNKSDNDYYCPQIRNNFQVKRDVADFFLLSSTPSEESKKLVISGISSKKKSKPVDASSIYRRPAKKQEFIPWRGKHRDDRFQVTSPSYNFQKLNGVPQYDYLARSNQVREKPSYNVKLKSHSSNIFVASMTSNL